MVSDLPSEQEFNIDNENEPKKKSRFNCNSGISSRVAWNGKKAMKDTQSLQLRQHANGSVYVDGLTCRCVSTKTEMLKAFIDVTNAFYYYIISI